MFVFRIDDIHTSSPPTMIICVCMTAGFVFAFFGFGVYLNSGFLCIADFEKDLGVKEDHLAALL